MTPASKSLALGLIIIVVSVISIVGNMLSLIVLFRPKFRAPVYTFLCSLIASDSIFIIQFMGTWGVTYLCDGLSTCEKYFAVPAPFVNYLVIVFLNTAQYSSVYLTVAVSVDRYIAVCHPIKSAKVCTVRQARRITTIIFLVSFLCHFSKFWEFSVQHYIASVPREGVVVAYRLTRNKEFASSSVLHWIDLANMLLAAPVPFVSLAVLNTLIVIELRRLSARKSPTSPQKPEKCIARIVVSVVIVFGLSHATNIVAHVLVRLGYQSSNTLLLYGNLSIALGSSFNFIIYCVMGPVFRSEFLKLFCR